VWKHGFYLNVDFNEEHEQQQLNSMRLGVLIKGDEYSVFDWFYVLQNSSLNYSHILFSPICF
jgi:hypothetical protein